MNILRSPTKFRPSPKPAITTLDSFVVSVLTLIPPQRAPLPPQSFTVILYNNLPKTQLTRLQQIQNSLARAVVKALKSCHITTILRYLHWLKITERIEYKLFSLTKSSQPPNFHICITSSLFSLIAALDGINFLVLSVNLIPVSPSLTCLFMLLPHLLTLSAHHSHHP